MTGKLKVMGRQQYALLLGVLAVKEHKAHILNKENLYRGNRRCSLHNRRFSLWAA